MKQTTITKGGQVSIPAEVRHRWATRRLLIEDRGSELVFRPLPDDPIAAARGVLRRTEVVTPSSDDARRQVRREEAEATTRNGSRR
jgi:bifunctional DNA-binding transcriptional regulator/antitoxin component of YhaV-PrlF toxin-antitoxin module